MTMLVLPLMVMTAAVVIALVAYEVHQYLVECKHKKEVARG
ncbi:MAG: hypothetical protein OXQ29_26375 [Rhodospirillaceae bacterium]|nr:hypothetical protein [Rhodospirillaceae bacterium]